MTYSESEKHIIRTLRDEQVSWSIIAKVLKKSERSLITWWSRNRQLLDLPPKDNLSKTITDGRVGLRLKKLIQENPEASVRDLEGELKAYFGEEYALPKKSTIQNFIQRNDLKVIRLLKRPFISEQNRLKRLEFVARHLQDPDALIDATIWSDETTVRKAPKDKAISYRVHSSVNAEDLPFNCQIQQGGFSVMFWGCISVWGIGPLVALEGSQNQHTYTELLQKYLVPEFEAAKRAFGINFIFMQDNAPCHKTRKVISFLERKRIPTLDWPPQSPDLNPIENIWNIIKTRRYKKFGIPHSKVELIEQIFKIWEELTVEDAENCIGNMERRFQEVVRMNGRPTRY
jgi:hypothetical protein